MSKREPLFPHISKSSKLVLGPMVELMRSINEEDQAVKEYSIRAKVARNIGDMETARLFEHIAEEEKTHAKELRERMHALPEPRT